MKSTFFSIIFFFYVLLLSAQILKGKVFDSETQLPLNNAHVYINNNSGTYTDVKGRFRLKLANGIKQTDSLIFSHIGYLSKRVQIKDVESSTVIFLDFDKSNLDAVNLLSKRKLRPTLKFIELATMKVPLSNFCTTLIDDRIFVFGGDLSTYENGFRTTFSDNPTWGDADASTGSFTSVLNKYFARSAVSNYSEMDTNDLLFIYNISNNEWMANEYGLLSRAFHQAIFDEENNKVYVLGGKRFSTNRRYEFLANEIEVFDLKTNKILVDKINPHQAINFSSFIYKGNLLVMGGATKQNKNGTLRFSDKITKLDIKTGLWYEVGNMPEAKEVSGILVGNVVYIFGGYNGTVLKSIETFNLETGKWRKIGELFKAVKKPALAHNNQEIFIYDGDNIITLDLRTGDLKEYNISINFVNSSMVYKDNKLFVLGGEILKSGIVKNPSNKLYSVVIDDFDLTKVTKAKKVNIN